MSNFKKRTYANKIDLTHKLPGEAWQVSQWWRTPPTSSPLWWSWTPAFPLDLTLLRRRTCWRWEFVLVPKYLFYFSVLFIQLLPFTVWRTSVLLFGTLLPVHILFSRFLKSKYKEFSRIRIFTTINSISSTGQETDVRPSNFYPYSRIKDNT